MGDVYIPRDMRTGDPRGFAFVRYLDQRDADDAIDRLDGERLGGRELRIQVNSTTIASTATINAFCRVKLIWYGSNRFPRATWDDARKATTVACLMLNRHDAFGGTRT